MSEDSERTDEHLEQLRVALAELEPVILGFKVRDEWLPGDLTIQAYLLATWDNAKSVEALLRTTDLSIGPFACARAALEAGQSAALLASEPDYLTSGARARVFEVLEYSLERSRWANAFPENPTANVDRQFDGAVRMLEGLAAKMDAHGQVRGDSIRDALAYWLPDFQTAIAKNRNTRAHHWSRLGPRRIAEELAGRRQQPHLAEQLSVVYSMLSRYSHPRAHPEGWRRNPSTRPSFILNDPNRPRAAQIVGLALILARDAVKELQPA
jgi:hypothetical protein